MSEPADDLSASRSSRGSTTSLRESLEDFDELCEPGANSVKLRDLPALIQLFQDRKGIEIIEPSRLEEFHALAENPVLGDNAITVDELLPLIEGLVVPPSAEDETASQPVALPSPRSLQSSESGLSLGEPVALNTEGSMKQVDEVLDSDESAGPAPDSPVTAIKVGGVFRMPRSISDQSGLHSPGTPSRVPIPASPSLSLLNQRESAASPLSAFERSSPLGFASPEMSRPSSSRANKSKKARRESLDTIASSREPTPDPPAATDPSSPLAYRGAGRRSDSSSTISSIARRKSSLEAMPWTPPALESLDSLSSPPIEHASFRSFPLSPSEKVQKLEVQPEASEEAGDSSLASIDMSRAGSLILREFMGDNSGSGLDFFRGSVSDSVGPDHLARIFRDSDELARKVKELEEANLRLQEDYEAQLLEIQSRLDELQSELSTKRKENKELAIKRDQHLSTIRDNEKEIAQLETTLTREKEAHAESKRRLDETCVDADKLREDLQLREQTMQQAEIELRDIKAEHEQLLREYQVAETQIKQYRDEIEQHKTALGELQSQKDANMALQEELSRVRAELEAALSARQSTEMAKADSRPGTISRSLSREVERRLAAMPSFAGSEADSVASGDTEIHSIAMLPDRSLSRTSSSISMRGDLMAAVQLRRSKNGTSTVERLAVGTQTIEDEPVAVTLGGVGPSMIQPPLQADAPPPYSPPGQALQLILERYAPTLPTSLAKVSPVLHDVVETTAGFVFYSATLYLLGVITGVVVLPSRVVRDDPYWALSTSLLESADFATGSVFKQRALYWLNELIWAGVDRQRRVPT